MDCFQFGSRNLSLNTLQRHLPLGEAWAAFRRVGKKAYDLLQAIAESYEDMTRAMCAMISELDPRSTEHLISEWETALSLPDPCLPTATTIDERRFWVQWRLDKRRYSTEADWHYLASLFGLEITITPGWYVQKLSLYPGIYPKPYDNFPRLGRFRVYINLKTDVALGYNYGEADRGDGYPIPYGVDFPEYDQLKCLIERVKPAHVAIIWDAPIDQFPYFIDLS